VILPAHEIRMVEELTAFAETKIGPEAVTPEHVLVPAALFRKLAASTLSLHRRRLKQQEWSEENRAAGLCTHCSRPAVEGKTRCEEHLRRNREGMAARRVDRT